MKLFVTIPAYNEEKTISKVIKGIPRDIPEVDSVKVIVINDGSTDRTEAEAQKAGADYIISNQSNRGLGYSFRRGLNVALKKGGDIVLNIDADSQYNPAEIPKLIKPILENRADMLIGNRQVRKLKHMPLIKKWGNTMISWLMRVILRNKISDASPGFRAFSKECASRLNIKSNYTYTLESLVQCTFQKMRIKEIPIEFRKRKYGQSRLIKSLFKHIVWSVIAVSRSYLSCAFSKIFKFLHQISGNKSRPKRSEKLYYANSK